MSCFIIHSTLSVIYILYICIKILNKTKGELLLLLLRGELITACFLLLPAKDAGPTCLALQGQGSPTCHHPFTAAEANP